MIQRSLDSEVSHGKVQGDRPQPTVSGGGSEKQLLPGSFAHAVHHLLENDFDLSGFDARYRNDDTGFNVDAGLAADFGDNWTVGLTGKNLFSRDIDTKEVDGVRDTYQISPVVTAGVAWHTDLVTLTADGDLTETKGFKSEENSQYVGVGAEVTPLSWLAVRAGYRADVKDNDSNVFTAGVGFAPLNTVHIDLMGLYGEDETWGAGAQLSMTF